MSIVRPVTLKVYMTLPTSKQEIRRFTTSEPEVLPALLTFLETTYSKVYQPPLRFLIQYDDGEDLLTISSEAELREGLQVHLAQSGGNGNAVWKLMCRFDDSMPTVNTLTASASNASSPSALSGMSTPSVNTLLSQSCEFPPSPSRVNREVSKEQPTTTEKTNLLGSATSPRSDEDDLDLVDARSPTGAAHASAGGSSSDDEYVRIEEDAPAQVGSPAVVVEKSDKVASPTPTAGPAAATVVAEVDPFAAHYEQRAPERFACRHCPKLFKAAHFVIEHIRNKHPAVVATLVSSSSPSPAAVQTTSEFSTQTSSTAQGTHSTTQTDSAPSVVASSTQTVPVVDESASLSSSPAVEIADVTGHHEENPSCLSSSPEPSSVESPSANGPAAVHKGIACDGCGASPIVGCRYHCTACTMPGGYDLCEKCESAGDKHPLDHVLLKMRTPANVPVGTAQRHLHCPRRAGEYVAAGLNRPKAQFVSDVTLADGLQVHAGETLQKVWSFKNTGDEPWPIGTRLVFAGGDLAPESDNLTDSFGAAVPYAGPNDVVHIALSIVVPNEPGRYRSTFRLETPQRVRFGPRAWIDVVVPQEPTAATTAATQETKAEPVQPTAQSTSAPAPVPVAAPVSASSPPVASALPAEPKQVEEAVAPKPSFQYANQLATLRSMGFKDPELCRYLLLNNAGDLGKVVQWLLENAH